MPPRRLDPGAAVVKDFERPLQNLFGKNAAKPCA
jgi:hypothetical protein